MAINSNHILIGLLIFLIFLVILFFIKLGKAGFADDKYIQKYEHARFLFERNRLNYKNLKKVCPNCSNVDYNRMKTMLQEGKIG